MHRLALVLAAATLVAAVPTDPPGPVQLTADEADTVSEGGVITRYDAADGMVTGVVDVAATPDAVMTAAVDLRARQAEQRSIQSIVLYEETPEHLGAEWTLSILTSHVVFNILYDIDRPRGWCSYELDTSRHNDIDGSRGAYHVYPYEGGTRLVYYSWSDLGRRTPGWVKKWLAQDSLETQLMGIKRRAEAK